MNRLPASVDREVQFCVSGAVTIHPTAAIASNVMLRANPGSTLIIGAGAVLGQGCVLHACDGTLELGAEVTLGNHVLVVGHGHIQSSACIGTATTLMGQIDVDQGTIVPPHSLLGAPDAALMPPLDSPDGNAGGDRTPENSVDNRADSRNGSSSSQGADVSSSGDKPSSENGHAGFTPPRSGASSFIWSAQRPGHQTNPANSSADSPEKTSQSGTVAPASDGGGQDSGNSGSIESSEQSPQSDSPQSDSPQTDTPSPSPVVYGQASVQRLISVMFPHRTL